MEENLIKEKEIKLLSKKDNLKTTNKYTKSRISVLSKYLILHLKLNIFFYDKKNNSMTIKKIKEFIEVPKELNLKKYCTEQQNNINFDYVLYGLVRHYGGAYKGHYTAAIKNGENWYNCNGPYVSLIENPFPDDKTCSKNLAPIGTCLLFYKVKENENILPEK